MTDAGGASRLAFVQVLRGLAALLVILWHFFEAASAGLLADIPRVATASAGPPAPAAASASTPLLDAGQVGVAVFFLISGFVIPFAFQRQTRLGFAIGRFFRIWPTYAAGFSIGLLVLLADEAIGGKTMTYSLFHILTHYSLLGRDVAGFSSIDLVVWTLEIEIRFYIFCMLIAPLFLASHAGRVVAAGLVVALLALVLCEISLIVSPGWLNLVLAFEGTMQFISFMMIGVMFHLLFIGTFTAKRACVFGAVFFLVFVWVGTTGADAKVLPWVLANYGAGLAVFSLAYLVRTRFAASGPLGLFGDISYPLYVIHPLLGSWIVVSLVRADIPVGFAAAIAFVVACASAWVLHEIVEKPSHAFGRKFSGRPRRSPIPAPAIIVPQIIA